MEEKKNGATEKNVTAPETTGQPVPAAGTEDEKAAIDQARKDLQKTIQENLEKQREMIREANAAIAEGKGKIRLETPITVHETEYKELEYDFTVLKGLEYTDAMDSDPNAMNSFNITKRQALALFAKAAAKQTEGLDMQDIVGEIGMTDSVEAVEIATLFFNASRRAGRMRISKRP